jgi:hypothetical protein
MSTPTYNRIIRKLVVGFGGIFDKINLVRYNPDNTEAERFLVPIAYSPKELYVQRLQGDPDLDKKVQITLPRLSFEMTGLSYDVSRKQNTNDKIFAQSSSGVVSQYNPVPYNFDFDLVLYTRNIEDAHQIIEHILPFFTPSHTIKLNLVPELGITKEIPITLNTTDFDITYEGDRDSDTRMIIWTLKFTAKGYIFGQISTAKLITTAITNISKQISQDETLVVNLTGGVGTYQEGEIVYQGYSLSMSTGTAKVVSWNSSINQIKLTNFNGTFKQNEPLTGDKTSTAYIFNTVENPSEQYAQIVVVPNPTDANANSYYTYTSTITESPNINNNVVTQNNFDGDLNVNVFGIDDLNSQNENPINLGT